MILSMCHVFNWLLFLYPAQENNVVKHNGKETVCHLAVKKQHFQVRVSSTYTKSFVLHSLNLCQMSGAHTHKKKNNEKVLERITDYNN